MVRRKLLLVGLALVSSLVPSSIALAAAELPTEICSVDTSIAGTCPGVDAAVGDGRVDVSAGWEHGTSGRDGAGGAGGGSDTEGGAGWDDDVPDGAAVIPGAVAVDMRDASPPGSGLAPRRQPVVDPAAPACEPQTPCDPDLVVRVSDLVSIPAEAPNQGMEPDGWLVVGIATNFFASASTHVRSGTLLGAPADVRFTPVGYTWDYGDGTAGSTASGGASWAALRLAEFSETATSHVFDRTGTVSIGLVVSYAAEYRFAGAEWRAVQGLVEVQAAPMTAIADRAGTVLVAESCSARRSGPGC